MLQRVDGARVEVEGEVVGEITGERDPSKTVIPVIGGHSGETIVPLFSQSKPAVKISDDKLDALVNRKWNQSNTPLANPLTSAQVFSSVVMRSSRPRTAQVPPPSPWHTPASVSPRRS